MQEWRLYRAEESRGFVSRRIADAIIHHWLLMFGEAFSFPYSNKNTRVIHPKHVILEQCQDQEKVLLLNEK